MPFYSRTVRDLKDSMFGVKPEKSDPLQRSREEVTEYLSKAKELQATLLNFQKTVDEMGAIREDVVRQSRNFLMPLSEGGQDYGSSSGQYAKVGELFANQIEIMSTSKANTRSLLNDAIADAGTLIERLTDLQTQFSERDKAGESVEHYRQKLSDLNTEQVNKPKKDIQDRIKRNIIKYNEAVSNYQSIDDACRSAVSVLLESRQADFSQILENMCLYIATNVQSSTSCIPVFTREIPDAVEHNKAVRDEQIKAMKEATATVTATTAASADAAAGGAATTAPDGTKTQLSDGTEAVPDVENSAAAPEVAEDAPREPIGVNSDAGEKVVNSASSSPSSF